MGNGVKVKRVGGKKRLKRSPEAGTLLLKMEGKKDRKGTGFKFQGDPKRPQKKEKDKNKQRETI